MFPTGGSPGHRGPPPRPHYLAAEVQQHEASRIAWANEVELQEGESGEAQAPAGSDWSERKSLEIRRLSEWSARLLAEEESVLQLALLYQASLAAFEEGKDAFNKTAAEVRAIEAGSPLLQDWKGRRNFLKGPTEYATTSVREAFAEAFRVWKVDPKALRRVEPEMHRYFAEDAHLSFLP